MITFKDRTFCPFHTQCHDGSDCPRALTPFVVYEAGLVGLSICQFAEKPDCYNGD
jgi:hypothetical protein